MATNYYKRKVFVRAEGVLKTCVIPEYKYAWADDTNLLVFFIPKEIDETVLCKAVQYMKSAFRKVRVDLGPVYSKETTNRFIRTIAIRFNKDAIIKKEGANV